MLDFNTFIFIAIAVIFVVVGLVVWIADAGVPDKYKTVLALFVLVAMAGLIALFWVIDDESEFEYAGYEKMDRKGGGGKQESMMAGGGGEGEADAGGGGDDGGGGGDGGDGESDAAPVDAKVCDVCPDMVSISPGMAMLGSTHKISSGGLTSGPAAQKNFSKPFSIGKFEVTVGEFQAFVDDTKYAPVGRCGTPEGASAPLTYLSPGFDQTPKHPVVCLSWADASKYAQWLTDKSPKQFRLPTEAEWEFAARAGVTTEPYMTGERLSLRVANFRPRTGKGKNQTTMVGIYPPNGNGIYDVHGNVWEMVGDCWSKYYQLKPAPNIDCTRRIVKGGSFSSPEKQVGFPMRGAIPESMALNGVGFRVMHE